MHLNANVATGQQGQVQASAVVDIGSHVRGFVLGSTPLRPGKTSADLQCGVQLLTSALSVIPYLRLPDGRIQNTPHAGAVMRASAGPVLAACHAEAHESKLTHFNAMVSVVSAKDDGWSEPRPYTIGITHGLSAGSSLFFYSVFPRPESIWRKIALGGELTLKSHASFASWPCEDES